MSGLATKLFKNSLCKSLITQKTLPILGLLRPEKGYLPETRGCSGVLLKFTRKGRRNVQDVDHNLWRANYAEERFGL